MLLEPDGVFAAHTLRNQSIIPMLGTWDIILIYIIRVCDFDQVSRTWRARLLRNLGTTFDSDDDDKRNINNDGRTYLEKREQSLKRTTEYVCLNQAIVGRNSSGFLSQALTSPFINSPSDLRLQCIQALPSTLDLPVLLKTLHPITPATMLASYSFTNSLGCVAF